VPEILRQIESRHVSFGGAFRERLDANSLQFPRNAVVALTRRARFLNRDLLQQLGRRITRKRTTTHEQLIEHDAEAENIAATVDPMSLAARLLGTHILGRAGVRGTFAHVFLT
jgi:hypothetical protein